MRTNLSMAMPHTQATHEPKGIVPLSENGTDRELFQQFLEGDDNAFMQLFRNHNQRIHMYCLKIVGNQEQTQDITQEMWERVIQMRRKPQDVINPVGFFLRIARNLCIDTLRARKHPESLDELPESSHPVHQTRELSEQEELVLKSLNKLSYDYREVLVLSLYSGYRYDEIAGMLGKNPEAIWARASRARAQLRKLVTDALQAERNRTRNFDEQ